MIGTHYDPLVRMEEIMVEYIYPLLKGTEMSPTAYKVKPFTGELPALNGKSRIPTPFDEIMAKAYVDGKTLLVEVGEDDEERASVIAQLHKAAKYVGCGLDLWRSLPEGVAFKAREKREIVRNAPPAAA